MTVTSANPSSGSTFGGQTVTLIGTNFTAASRVKIGTNDCTPLTFVSSMELRCTTASHWSGAARVEVEDPNSSPLDVDGLYTYLQEPVRIITDPAIAASTSNPLISPNGKTVVYSTNIQIDVSTVQTEVYAVNIDGSGNRKISGTMVSGGSLASSTHTGFTDKFFTDDSRHFLYIADQETDGVNELFAAKVDGSGATKLNDAMPVGGNVTTFFLTPDTTKVLYVVKVGPKSDLHIVNIDGTGHRLLTPGSHADMIVNHTVSGGGGPTCGMHPCRWGVIPTADSAQVVFLADQDADDVFEIYNAALDGSSMVKLSGPMVTGGDAARYMLSADGTRVLYLADQDTDALQELYSVKMDGTGRVKLNESGRSVAAFQVTTTGKVVYTLNGSGFRDLMVADLDGTNTRMINTAQTSVSTFVLSRAMDKVFFTGRKAPSTASGLFVADLAATYETNLSGTMVTNGNVSFNLLNFGSRMHPSFAESYDGRTFVFYADKETDGVFEYFAAAVDGSSVRKIGGPTPTGAVIQNYVLVSPNDIAYIVADFDTLGVKELYAAPFDGSSRTKVNLPITSGGLYGISATPDLSTFVFGVGSMGTYAGGF